MPVDRNRGQHSGMQSVQNLEAVINEGLRVALLEKTPDQSLEVLLEHLGKALKGERTYIFERNEAGGDDNTYEWTAEGVEPEKENLQNVPPQVCANWYRNFSIGRQQGTTGRMCVQKNWQPMARFWKYRSRKNFIVLASKLQIPRYL